MEITDYLVSKSSGIYYYKDANTFYDIAEIARLIHLADSRKGIFRKTSTFGDLNLLYERIYSVGKKVEVFTKRKDRQKELQYSMTIPELRALHERIQELQKNDIIFRSFIKSDNYILVHDSLLYRIISDGVIKTIPKAGLEALRRYFKEKTYDIPGFSVSIHGDIVMFNYADEMVAMCRDSNMSLFINYIMRGALIQQ